VDADKGDEDDTDDEDDVSGVESTSVHSLITVVREGVWIRSAMRRMTGVSLAP
jgi:hypothetical protein